MRVNLSPNIANSLMLTGAAVADLRLLSELCIPFVKVGGAWIAMKNQSGLEEIESASKAVEILGGEAMSYQEVQSIGPDGNLRTVVTSYKLTETDKKYPRRAGTPQKKTFMMLIERAIVVNIALANCT